MKLSMSLKLWRVLFSLVLNRYCMSVSACVFKVSLNCLCADWTVAFAETSHGIGTFS